MEILDDDGTGDAIRAGEAGAGGDEVTGVSARVGAAAGFAAAGGAFFSIWAAAGAADLIIGTTALRDAGFNALVCCIT